MQMNCSTCGKELEAGAAQCAHCGALVEGQPGAAEQQAQPTAVPLAAQDSVQVREDSAPAATPLAPPENVPAEPWAVPAAGAAEGIGPAVMPGELPQDGKKSRKKLPIILVAVLLVLALLAVLLVPRLRKNLSPEGYVLNALANTASSLKSGWKDVGGQLGTTGLLQAYEGRQYHQSVSVELAGASMFERFGISVEGWVDYPARRMDGSLGVQLAGLSLAKMDVGADDAVLYGSLPALLEGSYGINTETFGDDYAAFSGEEQYRGLGFNLFDTANASNDLFEMLLGTGPATLEAATSTALKGLQKELLQTLEAEKGETVAVDVNGHSKEAEQYTLAISGEALEAYITGAANALADDGRLVACLEQLTDVDVSAIPGYESAQVQSAADTLVERFAELADLLQGGITGEVYIQNGVVVRMDLAFAPYGDEEFHNGRAFISLEIGGEEHLVDALSAAVGFEDNYLAVSLAGQHQPVDGVFESALAFTAVEDGFATVGLVCSLEWDTQSEYDNFSASLGSPFLEAGLEAEGTLVVEGKTGLLDAKLNRLVLKGGPDEYAFTVNCMVEPMGEYEFAPASPRMLLEMSEEELEALVEEMQDNLSSMMFGLL